MINSLYLAEISLAIAAIITVAKIAAENKLSRSQREPVRVRETASAQDHSEE